MKRSHLGIFVFVKCGSVPVLLKSMMDKYILLQTVENYHRPQGFSYWSSLSRRALIGPNISTFCLRSHVMA